MKTLFRPALAAGLLLAAGAPARAQAVPNGGFETWAARAGVDSPTGWLTTDDVVHSLLGLPLATGTFSKVADAHGGSYAVRLESKTVPLFGVVPGAVALGSAVGTSPAVPGGLSFTGRPATLQFYYKLSGAQPAAASDGAFAQVALTRTVSGKVEVIASAKQVLSTVDPAYALAQVPLTYASSATPDSVRLVFSSGAIVSASGGLAGSDVAGTVLQVDDVAFAGTVTATRDAALAAVLTASPNPSRGGRFVLRAPAALLAAPLAVVDATGRIVRCEDAPRAAATRALDLSGLAAGVYTLQLFTGKGLVTRQLVVE